MGKKTTAYKPRCPISAVCWLPIVITSGFVLLYGIMQTNSIYAGDSGGLVSASYIWGIAHPPGYPLYVFLGALVSHGLWFGTIAWRVGFLSSISMAVSVFFVWYIVYDITRSKISATVSSCMYGLLYPVWLYAIVPEVFGLFSLFTSAILFLFLRWYETGEKKYLLYLSGVGGLSLTHHHLIVLLLAAIAIFIYTTVPKYHDAVKRLWLLMIIWFIMGFSVYLYAPIASSRNPALDWEHPANPVGFFRLITRSSYGTFKASYVTGQSLMDRFLNILTFFQLGITDITFFGGILVCIGFIYIYTKDKKLFRFFLLYFGLLLFYFFYAGFPVDSDFSLGTLERFFIIPYQFLVVCIGIGLTGVYELLFRLETYWKHKTGVKPHIPFRFLSYAFVAVLIIEIIPLSVITFNRLKILKNDTTLERLADDIFTSTPENALLSLSEDTSVYAVDYAYYVLRKRQDIKFISFPMLIFPIYRTQLKQRYPSLVVPDMKQNQMIDAYTTGFINANYPIMPIADEKMNVFIPDFWVTRGLIVLYYPTLDSIPNRDLILHANEILWKKFQDPLLGSLGVYKHMLLTDTLRYYANRRLQFAQALLAYGRYSDAQTQMQEAIRLTPLRYELYSPYIMSFLKNKECGSARDILQKIGTKALYNESMLTAYGMFRKECPTVASELPDFEHDYTILSSHSAEMIR